MTMQTQDGSRELDVFTIDVLKVDHRYQRELNQRLVEDILRDWDPLAADAITVSRRTGGDEYIVNGQHRAAAARLKGETEILGFVYEGLTVEQESALRLKANNRRADTSLERFHAQVTAGNAESLAIVRLLAEYETRVNRVASGHTGMNCVSTLEFLYRDDPALLRLTLEVLKEAHGDVQAVQATVPVVRGTAWFLKAHRGDYHHRSLVERLRQHGAEDLLRRARSHKAVSGGPMWLNYYRAAVETYNHRRQPHTRIEATTKHWGQAEQPKNTFFHRGSH